MRPLLAALLLASLAGCAGSGGDPAPAADAGTGAATPAMPAVAPATAWTTETFTGDFVTTNPVYPGGLTGDTNPFQLPDGALEGWFNITVTGALPGDVDVRYVSPDCAPNECTEQTTAEGGHLETLVRKPAGGEWQLIFFAPDGVQQGTYTLDVALRMPA